MAQSSELLWFRNVCRAYALIPLLVGSTVALTGTAGYEVLFRLSLGPVDPSLESAVRFLAATFSALGLVLVGGTGDVLGRRAVLRIFFGAMLAGAGVRLMAIGLHGWPNWMTMVVIGGELSAGPIWLWHERIVRRIHQST